MTQEEITILFGVDRTRIVRHIANIYNEGELDKSTTCAENAQVQYEGKREVNRKIKIYNLDTIISIGYRVKSNRGILFRRRANKILKRYLLDGYAIDLKKIKILNKVIELQNKMLSTTLNIDTLELEEVITKYTHALDLIDAYDYQRIVKPVGNETIHKI